MTMDYSSGQVDSKLLEEANLDQEEQQPQAFDPSREKEKDENIKRDYDIEPTIKLKHLGDNRGESSDRTHRGKAVLSAAEKGRLTELVKYISKDSTLVSFADGDKYTSLHRASYGGHIDCAKYLVKKGADIEAKTIDGWTPLHSAVRWNNVVVADFLVSRGADPNASSSNGNTPLHIAASNGFGPDTRDIIQLLLFHPDCDPTIKNSCDETAYQIAKRHGPFYRFWVGVHTLPDEEQVHKIIPI